MLNKILETLQLIAFRLLINVRLSSKNVRTVTKNVTRFPLDCHNVLYYNVGETTVYIDKVPVFSKSTYSESDGSIIVHYNNDVEIVFDSEDGLINELLVIEKKYYLK